MSLQVLHPITIHFPIVLPFLLVSLTALAFYKNGTKFPHLPTFNILIAVLLFASCGLAYWTGQRDSFGSAADPDAIANHARVAKYFLGGSAVGLFLYGWVWLKRPQNHWSKYLLLLVALALVAFTIWTSHLGGALVYQ